MSCGKRLFSFRQWVFFLLLLLTFISLVVFIMLASQAIYKFSNVRASHKKFSWMQKSNTTNLGQSIFTGKINSEIYYTAPEKNEDKKQFSTTDIDQTKVEQFLARNPSLIPQVYRKDHDAYKRYVQYLTKKEDFLPLQTKAVVLLTNYRSGSSFFGELLNQHPDVFYMFEPLIMVSPLEQCNIHVNLKKDIMKQLTQCIFPDWEAMYRGMQKSERPLYNRNIFVCTKHKFCFAPFTKELMLEDHCPHSKFSDHNHDGWSDCGMVNLNLVANTCRRKKMVAIKVIRLCDIYKLKNITEIPYMDLKVVHLIRDPRGIASSRLTLHPKLNLADAMKFTCSRQAANLDISFHEKPEWLQYKMFRYEDVALKPYHAAKSLYDFLGLKFHDSVKTWIVENTQQPIPEEFGTSYKYGMTETDKHRVRYDPWGHKRNSTSIVDKWKRTVPYPLVKRIEAVCSKVMNMVGYLPVGTIEEYKQTFSKHFFVDHESE
ncbi:carbohydrate sulfotransferase 1-like [Clavelina lepadiformis]|uniref:carbohydrate sulfotransferase 1-like n=1 Tax=Clavelina lepadiformis TaxID=159417 RepID=UPI004040F1D5